MIVNGLDLKTTKTNYVKTFRVEHVPWFVLFPNEYQTLPEFYDEVVVRMKNILKALYIWHNLKFSKLRSLFVIFGSKLYIFMDAIPLQSWALKLFEFSTFFQHFQMFEGLPADLISEDIERKIFFPSPIKTKKMRLIFEDAAPEADLSLDVIGHSGDYDYNMNPYLEEMKVIEGNFEKWQPRVFFS